MSQPRSTSTKPTPNADRYTVLLIITFIAMLIGCVLLYLELGAQEIGAFSRVLLPKSGESADVIITAFRFFA
jgi:hypothetical protein